MLMSATIFFEKKMNAPAVSWGIIISSVLVSYG